MPHPSEKSPDCQFGTPTACPGARGWARRCTRALLALTLGLALSLGWAALAPGRAQGPAERPEVTVEGGRIVGSASADGAVNLYLGIPYAAPPVGNLRWRPPQPVPAWSGPRPADRFGPMCLQHLPYHDSIYYQGELPTSEDCLTLNIWAPAKPGSDQLPVMVWIHPGGFIRQSGSLPLYDGANLARKGVIVVTLNYRLGLLGFIALPDLTKESDHHASGNYGLMDQIAALAWIQRNIAAYGGDARRVTLFGEGSGADSISYLAASPEARGLFARAIGESGGAFGGDLKPPRTLADAETAGEAQMRALHAASLAQLRNLPGDLLLDPRADIAPIIDGWIVPETVSAVYAVGRQSNGALIVGSNGDEASRLPPILPAAKFIEDVHRRYGEHADAFLSLYPSGSDDEARSSFYASVRDMSYGWQAWSWANLQTKTGEQAAFLYSFGHAPPFADGLAFREQGIAANLGAYHGAEIPYVFDNLDTANATAMIHPWRDADRTLARLMSSYWTNFARTGNPNGPDLPNWPIFKTGAGDVMIFGDVAKPGPVPHRAGLNLADQIYSHK